MGAIEHRGVRSGRVVIAVLASVASLAAFTAAGCGGTHSAAGASVDRMVVYARAQVQAALSSSAGYQGPRSGPRARRARLVVFVAADVTNGGIAGVATGVAQAAHAIGWPLRVLDGQASVSGRTAAMQQALAMHPSGIILGGFDATEQRAALVLAAQRHIPVVGWHAGPKPGPEPAAALFTNVTTDPLAVARLAALFTIAHSGGRAGVVIFYDSQFTIAVQKARAMAGLIERCRRCRLLAMIDSPIASAEVRVPALLSDLLQRYGSRLDYMLAINGNYFSGTRAVLFDLGRTGSDPPFAVAAGDGSASEFERIRSGNYQLASVADPLYLQGWQLMDELNRALAGQPPSGYLAPARLITRDNVPAGPVFDPATPYRTDFMRIWGR
jgi:ribose transport system substrate-binding protein